MVPIPYRIQTHNPTFHMPSYQGEQGSQLPESLLGGKSSHHSGSLSGVNATVVAELLNDDGKLKPGFFTSIWINFELQHGKYNIEFKGPQE